jgi:nucleoside-diphosphate-sugar epimerase
MAPLVLVTGPSGFIGAHVFTQLIKEGYSVRGTVRSQSKADYFREKFPEATKSHQISFVIVKDIAQPGAFEDAVKSNFLLHIPALINGN